MINQPNCKTCIHKGTDFYYGLCPQNDSEILSQEGNRCFYYEKIGETTMPYIKKELREKLNPKIENIIKVLLFHEDKTAVGEINYIITRLIHSFCVDFSGLDYQLLNSIMGILESAKQEFYRTVVAPYEDQKRKENGSVSELDKEKVE